jgi:hypothetical protein
MQDALATGVAYVDLGAFSFPPWGGEKGTGIRRA